MIKKLYYRLFKKKVKHSRYEVDGIKPPTTWFIKQCANQVGKSMDWSIGALYKAGFTTIYVK